MINYFKNRRIRLEAEAAKVKAQIDEYERVCKLELEIIGLDLPVAAEA